jgi:hypothetical protein
VNVRYDGGARRVRPDGSIEIDGRLRIAAVPAVVALLVSWGLMLRWPNLTPLLIGLWALALVKLPRRAHRLLVFDAGSRVLRVVDRGWRKRERVIAFADIHALAVEQRKPRRIALPVMTVNGEELLSVKDTFDNAHLEEEVQRLVGLPLRASPRGPDSGWIDF